MVVFSYKTKSEILEAKVLGGLARKKRSRRQAKEVETKTFVQRLYLLYGRHIEKRGEII
jgi:hypothetical protein